MPHCAILGCKNDSNLKNLINGGISYHQFPEDEKMKEHWRNATGRLNWAPDNSSAICSEHFTEKDFLISKEGYRYLSMSAIPKINVNLDKNIQNPMDAPFGPSKRLATPINESQSDIPSKKNCLDTSSEITTSKEEQKSENCPSSKRINGLLVNRLRWAIQNIKNQNMKILHLQDKKRKLKQKVTEMEKTLKAMKERFTMTRENPDYPKNTNLKIDTIVNAYKTLAKIPSVLGGRLSKNGKKAVAKWSVRNLDKGRTTKYVHSYMLDITEDDIEVIAKSDFGIDVSNEILSAVSPSEAFKAIVREEKEGKDSKKQYLEVWSKNSMVHSVDLNALDIHGEVYSDSELGGLEWSPDESSLVYVAEKKLKKSEPYIKRKSADKEGQQNEANVPKKGEEYIYRQDWGEQLVGRHLSAVVVFRLRDESFTILQGLPETWCPGQVRFTPSGDGVVGIALETEPRLGLVFCTNRPGYVFQLTMDGTFTKLSAEGMSVRSPRVSPAGPARLVWLQRRADGPHHACHELVAMDWHTKTRRTVIPIVDTEMPIENDQTFYGLYCQSLPAACFSTDGRRLVVSTPQRTEIRSYVVDLESGSMRDISHARTPGSTLVADVRAGAVLAVCSRMNRPAQVYVAKLPDPGQNVKWVPISSSTDLPDVLAKSKVEYLHLEHQDSQDSVKSFTALYLSPPVEEGKRLPLVVWPHGGPHSSFVNGFSIEAAMYAMLGFASLQINYRGSTGSGDDSVRFLPSRAGAADVIDCKLATDEAVRRYPVDPRNICLSGGSHGGFLVTHLSGQYPETYCAVVTRNPVIDVASMFGSSDIPDWYVNGWRYFVLGIATVRINFRGSIGNGDSSVRCLIGNVGNYDVADCYLALTTVRERDGCEQFCLYGGSYGGFTAAHLAARYPDLFSAMVLRNPLIDLATEAEYGDSSDGCAVEAGYEYSERGPASEAQLLGMRRCSPLAHAHRVTAPTALMLGGADRRVPCFQGLQYARRLQANGVTTRVYMYDDNHSLSSLPAEMDHLINGAHWLLTHLRS